MNHLRKASTMQSRTGRLTIVVVACTLIAGGVALGQASGPEQALRTAITAVNAASGAAGADVASVTETAEDAAGVSAQGTVDATAPLPPDTRSYREPTPDTGTAADIAAVKRDLVLNLRRDAMIMSPRTVPADLQTQLAEVYAASVLEAVTGETAAAMRHAAEDPTYRTYDDYRFVPTQWQGVQATPGAAVVTVLGYDSWGSGGTWTNDTVLQRQMVLANEAGRWKIVEQAAFDPAERRPRDAKQEFPDGLPRMP